MAKKWIQGAIKHKGALTKTAKAAGKSVGEFCASLPKNASTKTKRRCNLAKTLKGMKKK